MRKPSIYLSDYFVSTIWPKFKDTLLKERTQSDYFANVCMICDYLKEDFINITSAHAQDYFDVLAADKKHPLHVQTLHAKLSYLRSISSFIMEHKEIFNIPDSFYNVFFNVTIQDFEYYIDKDSIPTLEEMDLLFQACKDNEMLFIAIAFIFKCALTASEVCALTPKNITLDGKERGFITFRKQGKERYIKIPDDVMLLLNNYISHTGEREYLFYNKKNKVLKVRSLETLLKEVLLKAGIKKSYTLQDIRNASMAYMLQSGAKGSDVAEYTGTSGRWIYRYDKVLPELDIAPCDYVHIHITK